MERDEGINVNEPIKMYCGACGRSFERHRCPNPVKGAIVAGLVFVALVAVIVALFLEV